VQFLRRGKRLDRLNRTVVKIVEMPFTIDATLENFDELYRDLNPPVNAMAAAS
jgi:hypothetical protein